MTEAPVRYRLINGMALDDESDMQYIHAYRLPGVSHPFRFRLAWFLARLAYWVWTL